MIDNVHFSYRNGMLLSYRKDGIKGGIPYSSIKKVWKNITVNSIEGWRWRVIDNYIGLVLLVAQGQGGGLFIWDTNKNELVHYSKAPYCEDFWIYQSNVFTVHQVMNFVTPYHIEMWMCRFETKNLSEAGKRLYCKSPVRYDEYNSTSIEAIHLSCHDNRLSINVGTRSYIYSDDVQHIGEQIPNPNYSGLYKKWENQFDPDKTVMKGMIT